MEVILYSKECNWYTRCCLLNGGVRYREAILYIHVLDYHVYSFSIGCSLIILFH